MGNEQSNPAGGGPSPKGDNFKLIIGVGRSIESRLHRAGILTYAQFASLSPEVIITMLGNPSGLAIERINKQNWIGQARELALKFAPEESGSEEAGKRVEEVKSVETRRRNARFTVDLLIENDEVVETRVNYLRTGDSDKWGGWSGERFINFILTSADVRNVEPFSEEYLPSQVSVETGEAEAVVEEPVPATTAADRAVEPPKPIEEKAKPAKAPRAQPETSKPAPPPAVGLAEHKFEIVPAESERPSRVLRRDQKFNVRLLLDLANTASLQQYPVAYAAVIEARDLRDRSSQILFKGSGKIEGPGEPITITGNNLAPGSYILGATVTFDQTAQQIRPLSVGGGLLQIY